MAADAFFPELPRRILGWSPRSSLILVVSHAIIVCFPQCIVIVCVSRRVSSLPVFLAEYTAPRLLCYCQDTGIFTLGHRARVIFRVPSLLVFPCSFASGTARARSFCTHERSRTTESTVFEHIHHKDRRQLQLFHRLALHDRTASYVCARSRHICSISFWSLCTDMYRRIETSTCRLCKAADVQRSGPGPGRRAHEAVLSMGITITRRPSTISPSTSSSCSGHLSRQNTYRGVPSQGRHRSKVCACRRQQEPRLTAGITGRQRVKEDPLVEGIMCITRPAA